MALIMIPPGTPDGTALGTAIGAIRKPGGIEAAAKEATEWVQAAIAAVKTAPGSTYTDDEEIAGIILRGVETREKR